MWPPHAVVLNLSLLKTTPGHVVFGLDYSGIVNNLCLLVYYGLHPGPLPQTPGKHTPFRSRPPLPSSHHQPRCVLHPPTSSFAYCAPHCLRCLPGVCMHVLTRVPGPPTGVTRLGSPASPRIVPVDSAACRAYRDPGARNHSQVLRLRCARTCVIAIALAQQHPPPVALGVLLVHCVSLE